jgi:outer membrane protein OmpA-like peptidoglycan-associated protein
MNIRAETADVRSAVFDDEDFMIPLEMEADPYDATIELEAEEPVRVIQPPKRKVRKRDKWLVDELNSLNRKIDKLGKKDQGAKYDKRLDALETQLAEIREMLVEKENPIVPNTDNPIADLSEMTGKNITVQFGRYSNLITQEYELLLNELFVEMARNAQHKVLITGYADKSGNTKDNLRLSELRAQAVKYFFQERGIEGERLLVNYFGDSKSDQKNPEERRVEIEWLIAARP